MTNIKISVFAIIAGILLNGGLRLLNIALSPTGRVLDTLIFIIWVIQIGLIILLVLTFFFQSSRGADIEEKWQSIYIAAGAFALAGLISIPIGNQIARPIRQQGYEAFVQENQFLIDAIESYTADTGSPPENLEQLVPTYLDQSIARLIEDQIGDETRQQIEIEAVYDSIDRRSNENVLYSYKPPTGNDPWQLQVSIYLGSFQSTRFIYNPEENYSNRYRPVGRWGLAE